MARCSTLTLVLAFLVSACLVSACLGAPSPEPFLGSNGGGSTNNNNNSTGGDVDLAVTVGLTAGTLAPGENITYEINVTNIGPGDVTDATLTVSFGAQLNNVLWSAVFIGAATGTSGGTGNIAETVSLPAFSSIRYTVTADISTGTLGTTLETTATVTAPVGTTDSNSSNDSAPSSLVIAENADLGVTVEGDGVFQDTGGSVTYVIRASNDGPLTATGASVSSTLPAQLGSLRLMAVVPSAGASSGRFPVNLGSSFFEDDAFTATSGSSVTYVLSGILDANASGTLSTTVTTTPPSGITDPFASNNSATDTATVQSRFDLRLSTPTLSLTVTPGGTTTYALTAENVGPGDATNVLVTHSVPAGLSNDSWNAVFSGGATGTVSGVGNVTETVDMPAGSSVVYTFSADVDGGAVSPLALTGSINDPTATSDPVSANDSLIVTDSLGPQVDLRMRMALEGAVVPGGSVVYLLIVSNLGPDAAIDATVADSFPTEVIATSWTTDLFNGAAVANGAGTGDIVGELADIPAGGVVLYRISADLSGAATSVSNTATVAPTAGSTELDNGDNSATVTQ